jgi:hypothetical protein
MTTSNRNDTLTKSKELKIFVAGIPSTIKLREIKEYFATIGPVSRIEGLYPVKNSSRPDSAEYLEQECSKGCCIIATTCSSTYLKILKATDLRLLGRKLICKKYMQRGELYSYNQNTNLHRVLFKKVPQSITESMLREFLERHYGRVEVLYQFKTHELQEQQYVEKRTSNFNSYSATFSSKETAQHLAKLGAMIGPGQSRIIVQAFQYRSKDPAFPSKGTQAARNTPSTYLEHSVLTPEPSVPPKYLGGFHRSNPSYFSRDSHYRRISEDIEVAVKTKQHQLLIAQDSHNHKPTNRKYYSKARISFYQTLGRRTNIRLNIDVTTLPNPSGPK